MIELFNEYCMKKTNISVIFKVGSLALLALLLVACGNEEAKNPAEVMQTDKESIYREWLMNRLSKETQDPLNVQVSFSHWLTPGEFENLLSKQGSPKCDWVILLLPTEAGGIEGSRIPLSVDNMSCDEATLRHILSVHADEMEKDLGMAANSDWLANDIRETASNGDILVWAFRGEGAPKAIATWWNANSDSVRFIQPMVTELDNIQKAFEPWEPVR